MQTLAQRFVNGDPQLHIEDLESYIVLLDALAPKPSTTVLEAKKIAEKFLFPDDPSERIQQQITSGALKYGDVLRTVRPVALPMWIEWTLDRDRQAHSPGYSSHIRYGYLILAAADGGGPRIIGAIDDPNGMATISFDVHVDPMPFAKGHGEVFCGHYSKHLFAKTASVRDSMNVLIRDCLQAMFVLCTPRAASTAPLIMPRLVRRQHARQHKHPLIEFKTVTMHIGAQVTHSEPTIPNPNRDIIHKRLHKVIGHYRHYEKDRNEPLISFIPEHWRGDPSLGIVLHNRIIDSKPKDPQP